MIVAVVATLVAGLIPPPIDLDHLNSAIWVGIGVMVIPAITFAIGLPHLKVGFMASAWSLPRNTFLCSRPLLRLIGSGVVGNLFGTAILAFLLGDFHLQMLVILVPTAMAFIYSARKRLKKHPKSEFAMPAPLPYPIGRPMRRTKSRWPIGG